ARAGGRTLPRRRPRWPRARAPRTWTRRRARLRTTVWPRGAVRCWSWRRDCRAAGPRGRPAGPRTRTGEAPPRVREPLGEKKIAILSNKPDRVSEFILPEGSRIVEPGRGSPPHRVVVRPLRRRTHRRGTGARGRPARLRQLPG